jgi:hypothetical protein
VLTVCQHTQPCRARPGRAPLLTTCALADNLAADSLLLLLPCVPVASHLTAARAAAGLWWLWRSLPLSLAQLRGGGECARAGAGATALHLDMHTPHPHQTHTQTRKHRSSASTPTCWCLMDPWAATARCDSWVTSRPLVACACLARTKAPQPLPAATLAAARPLMSMHTLPPHHPPGKCVRTPEGGLHPGQPAPPLRRLGLRCVVFF